MTIVSPYDTAHPRRPETRLLIAFLILLAITSTAWSQAIVRGTVTDPLGSAVKDATVTLERDGANSGVTTTSADGAFTFTSVTAGR